MAAATLHPVPAVITGALDDDERFFDARSRTPSVELDELALSNDGSNSGVGTGGEQPAEVLPAAPLTAEERALLVQRVRALIDFYFGDANFSKDQFLRKHASSDPQGEGWISVELVGSFKKMKLLTTDASVVLDAMKLSDVIVLNSACDKLKRKEAMENFIEDVLARTIHLSVPRDTAESALRELCVPYGEIARVRLVDPDSGQALPADIAQHCVDEHGHPRFRQLPGMLSAFVQYGSIKQAGIASRSLNAKKDWRHPVHVDLIYLKPKNPGSASNSPAPTSREGSPAAAAALAGRYRSSSFHNNTSSGFHTNTSSGHHSPLAFDATASAGPHPAGSHPHYRVGSPQNSIGTGSAAQTPNRPRSSSFNVRRGSPGSEHPWGSPDRPQAQQGQQGQGQGQGEVVGFSPGARRRFLSPNTGSMPAMLSGRSGLSQVESPDAWRAREHQLRAQAILRNPAGPTSGRGFARHSAAPAVAAGAAGACPW